ncbi:hypothetical protein FBU59_006622 [Linderina macrospora]|uniref:Uncharacterized protein n=1 Tax=Linderina macrospora TaxID=4868 RepID=A0ACC1IZJ3_9FUNG|nr:hypothetical protein FBU59_006622 [Linderina macrospora]
MHQTADRITEFDANVDGPTTMEWIDEVNANLQFYIDVGVPKTAIISAIRRRMTGEVKQVVGYRKFEHLSHLGILLMEAFPQERFEMRAREKLGKLSTFNELPAYMIAPIGMNLLHRAEMNDTHCILLADTLSRLDTQAWYATGISPYMATTANIESLLTTFQQHYKKQ